MKKFGSNLTNRQLHLARAFEHAKITTYSQAVKAFERRDNQQIEEWKRQMGSQQQKEEK